VQGDIDSAGGGRDGDDGREPGKSRVDVKVRAMDSTRGSGEVIAEDMVAGHRCLPEWKLTPTELLLVDELGQGGDA
jgi:hypothetical protein